MTLKDSSGMRWLVTSEGVAWMWPAPEVPLPIVDTARNWERFRGVEARRPWLDRVVGLLTTPQI